MKGFYIITGLLLCGAVLGYFVVRPSDADLRRSARRIEEALQTLDARLVEVQAPLAEIRRYKRRTFKLDKDYDYFRNRAGELKRLLRAARYNMEHMDPTLHETTKKMLEDLKEKLNVYAYGVTRFQERLKAIHHFVTEGFPLLARMNEYRARLNARVENPTSDGAPLPADVRKEVETLNLQCEQIQGMANQALTSLHTQFEQGKTIAETTLNKLKNLVPTLEAKVRDLERSLHR